MQAQHCCHRGKECKISTLPLLAVVCLRLCFAVAACGCNSPKVREGLMLLHNRTSGQHWVNNSHWGGDVVVCTWYGVVCDAANAVEIRLQNNNLSGTLPPEISSVRISVLNVTRNGLSGTLPSSFGKWSALREFDVSHNNLSGTLPPEYSQWSGVYQLYVSNNSLSGTLPAAYASWRSVISRVMVDHNMLSGTLPSSYGTWDIQSIELSNNMFSGSLPQEYDNWTRVHSVSVGFNNFTGTLPPTYCTHWHQLLAFQVSNNRLTGALPAECNTSALRALLVNDNDFVGSVPTQWAVAIRGPMDVMLLHNNPRLSGTLSSFSFSILYFVSTCNTSVCGKFPVSWTAHYLPLLVCQAVPVNFLSYSADVSLLQRIAPQDKTRNVSCSSLAPVPAPSTRGDSDSPSATDSDQVSSAQISANVGVAIAVALSTTSGLALRRATLLSPCVNNDNLPAVDWTNAPLPLNIGPLGTAAHARHRGAVVGNIVLWVLAVLVAMAAVSTYHHVRHAAQSSAPRPLAASAAALRLPGALVAVVTLLLQQTTVSSVALVAASHRGGLVALDVGIGAAGIAAVLGVFTLLLWVLTRSFNAVGTTVGQRDECSCLSYLVGARVEWKPVRGRGVSLLLGKWFVPCFGVLFRSAALRRHWWTAADCGMSIVVCVVAGLRATLPAACSALKWLEVALTGLWAASVVWCQPRHRRLSCANTVFSNTMVFVIALLTALSVDADAVAAVTLVTVWISLAISGIAAVGSWWLTSNVSASTSRTAGVRTTAPSSRVVVLPTKASLSLLADVQHDLETQLAALVRLICSGKGSPKEHARE